MNRMGDLVSLDAVILDYDGTAEPYRLWLQHLPLVEDQITLTDGKKYIVTFVNEKRWVYLEPWNRCKYCGREYGLKYPDTGCREGIIDAVMSS